jgi:hypothetical protein
MSSAEINPGRAASQIVPELLGEVGMRLSGSPAQLDDHALQQAQYVIAIGGTGIDAATVGGSFLI